MRTILKLVIAALIIHGAYRAGTAFMAYYNFEDALRQIALFAGNRSDQELRDQAMGAASTLKVPVMPEKILIRRDQMHTYIDATYTADIEILPTYRVPWEFKPHVETLTVSVPR